MGKCKVSVIMGVLNAKNRVGEAIKSIQEQTFENWEFIICDDGSTDGTYEYLLQIAKEDKRLIIIKNEQNLGLARTLNKCIDNSKGEYIARMDDDDLSYVDRFAIQVDFLDKNKEYDFVSSAIDIYDGEKVVYKENVRSVSPTKEDFLWGSCFVHPATMFRTVSLKKANGYRSAVETRRAEDYDLFMRMYSQGMRGYNIEKSLLRYFVNPHIMKKRKYKFRLDEARVRYNGFKMLGLLPKGIPYVIKPLIVGLIPHGVLYKIKQK